MSGNENEGSALVTNGNGDVSTFNKCLNMIYFTLFLTFSHLITKMFSIESTKRFILSQQNIKKELNSIFSNNQLNSKVHRQINRRVLRVFLH
jgi:hypothetical protein